MRVLVIGAYKFGLTRNDDGTYVSTCLRDAKPVEKVEVVDETRHFKILSHTDPAKDYDVVVYPNGMIHCNCVGWGFRHNCSHCDDVRAIMNKEDSKMAVKCDFRLPTGCADSNCPSGKHSADRTIFCADCKEMGCVQRCDQSKEAISVK